MTVDLTKEEIDFLVDVLEGRLGTTRAEIYHTETHAFKVGLKGEKLMMERVIGKLGEARQTVAGGPPEVQAAS